MVKLGDNPASRVERTPNMPQAGAAAVDGERAPTTRADEPLPQGEWRNVTGSLAGLMSECGDLHGLSTKPGEDTLIAGVALRGLYARSGPDGDWQALGTAAGSAMITHRPSTFVFDPEQRSTWWVSGIYNGLGVFRTRDDGKSFQALGDLHHADSVAVDFTDPERKTLIVGGHETARTVYRSTDAGATWQPIGGGLPGDIACQSVAVLDARTYLIGCDYGGEGIYRTTDAGESWDRVSAIGGSKVPLRSTDGSIFWAQPNGGLVRSTDQGMTWAAVTPPGSIKPLTPVELPDGRIAALGSERILVSSDHGTTWKPASAPLPFQDTSGFVYSAEQKAFFIKHFQCAFTVPDTVLPDAIMSFEFDYER